MFQILSVVYFREVDNKRVLGSNPNFYSSDEPCTRDFYPEGTDTVHNYIYTKQHIKLIERKRVPWQGEEASLDDGLRSQKSSELTGLPLDPKPGQSLNKSNSNLVPVTPGKGKARRPTGNRLSLSTALPATIMAILILSLS
ncbi:hypothetical protein RUM43_005325 [Polyplax serrata]|uniref:Uncharacterized protein n=1 Tax=Polyplax serrata TaxID=468196 RepID=A0AAN8PDE8_POLSC